MSLTLALPSHPSFPTVQQGYCPFGTYQRATSGYMVRALTPKLIAKLIHGRLRPEFRRDHTKRAARHFTIRGALAHWREDLAMMDHYKF